MVETIDDIVRLIKHRDHLSLIEARTMVDDCVEEIRNAINERREYEAEDILRDWLGLEPDYLEIILNDIC